ncbi:hypothetical protein DAPPUDRAFT_101362 [Daphnia pulex]|uniref:Uncharacterized protein n=1 Tax=Daphnia pulex TaxID=6669 RepID=E9GD53_DAPPU|nr:hypothetical protein DAPPUDRAFT_101362 [Daphnia pulex]|eukprot:EFX82675.1 hypothetical protein DAPPUDRAFT_101362 [Daphnia pulex]
MAKVCFLLAALCGLASLSVTLAEPSSNPMYGAAPAKYPAPATYPAAPAPAKYETPTTTAKYEEKKEEYPMKMEYKKEEQPMMPESKKETYPNKMEYGGKKYRRSIDEDAEEFHSDEAKVPSRLSRKEVQAVRDAVIAKLLSESDPGFRTSFAKEGASGLGSFIGSKIRGGDPFTALNDARRGGKSKFAGQLAGNLAGGVLGGLLNDENCWRLGLSRKQAKVVRDAVMTKLVMESDPAFRKSFGKTFAQEGAGAVGSFIGSKIRGGDPFSVTVADLVQMYGRDPARFPGKFLGKLAGNLGSGVLGGLFGNEETVGDLMYGRDPARRKFLGNVAGSLGAGVVGGLLGNEEALSMEELDDMMDDF